MQSSLVSAILPPEAARTMLATSDVASIAGDVLAPALDEVGTRYDEGTYFLPQLMASAEAAKSAFDVLSEASASAGAAKRNTLPIILATVEGDIHDIGKNIVKMLLENYGYTVIDLGRDAAPKPSSMRRSMPTLLLWAFRLS